MINKGKALWKWY